jgi:hypothetical protein
MTGNRRSRHFPLSNNEHCSAPGSLTFAGVRSIFAARSGAMPHAFARSRAARACSWASQSRLYFAPSLRTILTVDAPASSQNSPHAMQITALGISPALGCSSLEMSGPHHAPASVLCST